MNLFHKEFKQIISNKMFVITWICILVFMCIFMTQDLKSNTQGNATGQSGNKGNIKIGLINEDSSKYADMFVEFITQSDELSKSLTMTRDEKKVIEKQFYDGELDAYIMIPDNFINNIIDVNATPLYVKISDKDSVVAVLVSNILKAYQSYVTAIQLNVTTLNHSISELGYSDYHTNLECFSVAYLLIQEAFEKNSYMDFEPIEEQKSYTVASMLIYAAVSIVILYGSLFIGIEILKEKSLWVLNRYLISSSSTLKYITVKVLFYTLAIYILVFIPTTVATVLSKSKMNWSLLLLYLIFIFTSICMSTLLSFLTGEINLYALVSNMLYITSTILGGGIIPLMYLPENLTKLSKYTLTNIYIESFVKTDYYNSLSGSRTQIYICLFISVVCIISSSILFRKKFMR